MDVTKARAHHKAFWRSQERHRQKWLKEEPCTSAEKEYGQYLRTCDMLRGHAAGWIAGICWERRRKAKK